MAINAVYLGEDSLIDLSNDTVEEMAVDDGVQFHDANGEIRQGARVIDDTMSDTSTNAPQNKVVKKYVDGGLAKKSNIGHTHDSADIVSGVLATDRIPTITSSKIQSLDASKLTGTVPSSVLPSYVDDVVEGYFYSDNFYKDSSHTTAITGETGKIYVSLDTNKTYRYSGSKFVVISETLALGETSSTAYRGDRGKAAYDHATAKGSAFSNVLGKVTTNAQGHVTGITAVTKADITALGIPAQDTTYDVATQSKAGLESASDKTKLDGIAENANNYSLPTATASVLGGVKTGSNITNTSGVISLTKANVTSALGYTPPTTNTTYSKATASTDGLESKEHYSKIEGIASGAEVNQNAFSNVTIGENTIAADSKTDTLTLVAGSNVTLTADTENDKVTIAAKDTTYGTATTSANGLMSASDKTKLDGITASADAVSVSRSLTSGTKIGTITINGTATDLYCQTNTDTHYTTGLIVGASNTATANAAASNGSVYMNVLDNSTVRNAHKIAGSGSVTVSSDASGNITINGTNTTYSTLKNPYALTLSLNGTSQGAYDGSAAKSINITPSAIGAAASSHSHSYLPLSGGTMTGQITRASGSTWIQARTYAAIRNSSNNSSSFNVVASQKTKSGEWSIGSLGSDDILRFSYSTDSNFSSDNNSTTIVSLQPASGTIALLSSNVASATKATQDSAGQQINTTYIKGLSVSGKTITYTKGDGSTGTITTQDTNTTYSTATTSANGLMSASDKSKLDGIASGANAYSLPTATASVLGGVKVGSNITLSSGVISLTKANVTSALGYTPPTTNTTYSTATTSANGLMSASDKSKLDGIASGANAYSLPTATASVLGGVKVGSNITLSSGVISLTKANVTSALGYTPPTTNTTYSTATTSANGLMSASDKSKLDKISTITQGTLSAGSTSITLSNSNITESSVLDFYTSILGVNPLTIVPASGKVTLTFEAQSSAMTVGVRVCS